MKKFFTLCSLLFVGLVASEAQEINRPQPSPKCEFTQEVGLSKVSVEYSRPSVRGREIFGGLVPFGEMWRTGANASTKIEFSDDVEFGGKKVPAGKYALYTIPNKDKWTIILHKNLTYWGTGGTQYKIEEDAARVDVGAGATKELVESFTIAIENLKVDGADLVLKWANTQVSVPLKVNTDEQMEKQIQAFMNPKPNYRPYYNAASYYHETGKNLSQALAWVDEALKINKGFWISHLKAKIQLDLKDYKGAIETATISMEAAREANNSDYVALNEKLIAKAKAKK
ncbi:DUF2911 domain-containing protein [Luteibaculum oceani]|uniref:DUF2911 domain-containing protein n=1 Tax=Luteibaculum oceani TaxID=1294296 RepID=A0A5C6UUY3_9FLAO|nr:DUF2911 domain-containing protein [Luteibaculum oceani]TXC77077.1 DUF2911 domain-containing protein [Luteibaculum oceani]